jgi:hypothetical protein
VTAAQSTLDFTGPLPLVQERAQQRDAERDRSLEALEHGKHAEDIEIANGVAVQLAALDRDRCVTAPRLQAELERRGLIAAGGDTRWLGGVLTRKRWVRVGTVNEGSKARPVGLWRLREGSE